MEEKNENKENKIIWKETQVSEEEQFAATLDQLSKLEGIELTKGIKEAQERLSPERIANGLSFIASLAFRENNYKRTIALLNEYFKLETPEDEERYYELASSYLAIKDYENAKKVIDKENELFPGSELCDTLNADMLQAQGQHQEALKIYKKLYLSDPKEPEFIKAYYGTLAFYEYFIKNNYEKATAHLKEMLKKTTDEEIKDNYKITIKMFEVDKDIKEALQEATGFEHLSKKLEAIKTKAKKTKRRTSGIQRNLRDCAIQRRSGTNRIRH